MLTAEQINSIHRLHWAEHWSVRKIARHLHLARRTISQYLVTPARSAARRQRASKLDPFKATIAELLEQDAEASDYAGLPKTHTRPQQTFSSRHADALSLAACN
jgi:transposase